MNAAVRPIYFPGSAALSWLQQRALVAFERWASEWMPMWAELKQEGQMLDLHNASDRIQESAVEYDELRGDAGCIWFRDTAADRFSLGKAVAGAQLMPRSAYADEWIAEVVARAWDARNRALCAALLGAVAAERPSISDLPTHLSDNGSGAIELSCTALGLHAIVDRGVWRSMPPPERSTIRYPSRLVPLEQAVRGAMVSVEALLGSVEIALPQLLDLSRGDVLRLPLRLDEGIEVRCEGKSLARAALGETRGRRSVQLLVSNGENA